MSTKDVRVAEFDLRVMFQRWANNGAVWSECQAAIDAYAAAVRAEGARERDAQAEDKRVIDCGGMSATFTFDEALAEVQRLGLRCEELYPHEAEVGRLYSQNVKLQATIAAQAEEIEQLKAERMSTIKEQAMRISLLERERNQFAITAADSKTQNERLVEKVTAQAEEITYLKAVYADAASEAIRLHGVVGVARAESAKLRDALTKIARWHGEFPECVDRDGKSASYGSRRGSKGERDFMRQVALDALKENE